HQPRPGVCRARNIDVNVAAAVARTVRDAPRRVRLIPRLWIGAGCVGISIVLLPLFFPLDGKPHADWLQFFGRFHPLVVHLPIELLLCLAVRPSWLRAQRSRLYAILLTAVLMTLAWTAHQGGSLTHGSDYLTRYMPATLKRVLAPSAVSSHPNSFFARHIYPVLDTKCVACHGTNKEQGGLRLDSYESLMAGGKDGMVIAPRNPDGSLLLQKVTLPPTDHHFMPAEGRTPLTREEIARIRAWVLQGASPDAASVPGIFIAEDQERSEERRVGK